MVLIAALTLASSQVDSPALDGVELFRSACVAGEAHLPIDHAAKISSGQLPPAVKIAFGQNLIDPQLLASFRVPLTVSASDDLANSIYRIEQSDETFLVLPVNPSRKGQPFDAMCAVAVHGDRMIDALAVIAPKEANRAAKQRANGKAISAYFHGKWGKYDLSVAVVNGWTSIAAIRHS